MFESFKIRAEAAGAKVHRFTTGAEALAFILECLVAEGVGEAPGSYAVWADCPFLNGLDRGALAQRVPGLGFEVSRERSRGARVGITQMGWGIADTGTLVQDASAVEQRLASSLPWTHIALVGTGALVPDLATMLSRVDPAQHGYLAFITGPSRTADIERVLAIGVHGPERLVVVCVDELEGVCA